jgi:hypothetical protein
MPVKSKRLGVLTEIERDRLIKYESIDVIERKNLNFRLKKKLSIIKEAIEDINLLLTTLPEDTTKNYIDTETALYSIHVTEKILQLRAPWPVVEHDGFDPRAYMTKGQRIKDQPGECIIVSMAWSATDEEVAINRKLKEHIAFLQYFIDPYLINPVCLEPGEQIVSAEDAFEAIKNQTRRGLTINTYLQNDNPKHIIVKETDLKFKRWNPNGLPVKYDIPEQREEPPK